MVHADVACNLKMAFFLPESSAATQKLKLGRMNCWYRSDSSCRCLNQSVKISEAKHWWRQLLTLLVKSRASPALLLQKLVRPSLQVYRSRRKPAVAKKSTFLAWCLRKVKLWLLRNQTLGRKKTKAPPPPLVETWT